MSNDKHTGVIPQEWAKHLRQGKKVFWHRVRTAEKKLIEKEIESFNDGTSCDCCHDILNDDE